MRSFVQIVDFALLDDDFDTLKIIRKLVCLVQTVQIVALIVDVGHGVDRSLTILEQISFQAGGH